MTARLICLENMMNVTLHSEDNLHEIGYLATVELLKEEITGLRKENYKNRDDLAALKDKHNRFTGMILAAMSDEIKVMISGEVSEQLSKTAPDWDVANHRTEIMDVVNDDFDIDDHKYGVESIIDNHFCFDNYSDELNDMIRDYLNDCTVTIETP
jgi:hypothetical protein